MIRLRSELLLTLIFSFSRRTISTLGMLAICILLTILCNAQHPSGEFILKGKIASRDTGTIVLWYSDHNNEGVSDTAFLSDGAFTFRGTTNTVCEAILWTDLSVRLFDHPKTIRFLLEPGKIEFFRTNDSSEVLIKGSLSQKEKHAFDKDIKGKMLQRHEKLWSKFLEINDRFLATKDSTLLPQRSILFDEARLIEKDIRSKDLEYVRTHPESALSAYLLYLHKKSMPLDSVKQLFSSFDTRIKSSSIGHDILKYLFPQLDDEEFRKNNPLFGTAFNDSISKIESVHDLLLYDTSGIAIRMKTFYGKFLVLDFWASWCKPCLENIPAWKKLAKRYDSNKMAFISISLDHDETAWKKAIKKHNYTGIHLIAPGAFSSLAAVSSRVVHVPTYIIVDRNGNILNYNAPQPITDKLQALVDQLLNDNP